MKRFLCFLAALCLFFGAVAGDRSYVFSMGPEGLQPGDKVPDVLIRGLLDQGGRTEARLAGYRGRLLVLDFWATWCAPCVSMMPRLDSLQAVYGDRVQFLPVAYQSREVVSAFLSRLEQQRGRKERLPVVTGDTVLGKLFPHAQLPHFVWIGGDGIVKAITDQDAVNAAVIGRVLAGKDAGVRVKRDEVPVDDRDAPLMAAGRDLARGIAFSMSGYKEGAGRGYYNDTMIPGEGKARRITARNLTVPELFRLAYSKQKKESVLEVRDTAALWPGELHGDAFLDWLKQGHAFCMELVLPDSMRSDAYVLLREKLAAYFTGYRAFLEKRHVRCLALVRTSAVDKLRSAGGKPDVAQDEFGAKFSNCYLRVFLSRMQVPLQFNPLPLIDETGYVGKADLELAGDLTDLRELNRGLAKYDLRFEERPADLEMLVVRDAAADKP